MKVPFPSERTIEDYVAESIEKYRICPVSTEHVDAFVRQHSIEGYGVADIIKVQVTPHSVYLTVLELKNKNLNETHLAQLARYMTGLRRQAMRYERWWGRSIVVSGELAGPFTPKGDFVYLCEHLDETISVYDLTLDMGDGFTSHDVDAGWFSRAENLSGGKQLARMCFDAFKDEQEIIKAQEKYAGIHEADVIQLGKNVG